MATMGNYIEHERYRWSYMSQADLFKRLQKITKVEKVRVFKLLAFEKGFKLLQMAADRRLHELKILEQIKQGSTVNDVIEIDVDAF